MSDDRPLAGLPLRSVPETRPTRLPRDWFVYLSVVAFVARRGRDHGARPRRAGQQPIVRLCVLVGTPALVVALGRDREDLAVGMGWMPVDRVKGVFRLAWLVVPVLGLAATAAAVSAVLVA
jgi:hypothetical protein